MRPTNDATVQVNQDRTSAPIEQGRVSPKDPVKTAQIEVIDEAVKKAVTRWEIDPKKRYLLIVNTKGIQTDLIASLAMGLDRHGIHNVLIWALPGDTPEAIKLFEEQ